ncbi:MAG: prolyl oligopeptidase family serine peptidase [Saprospiraceae bacterium]
MHRRGEIVPSFDGLIYLCRCIYLKKWDQNHDGLPDEKMPAVIYVHGGPWQGWMEDNWLINRHLQLLADRGYLVVYAQYRGALTYGKSFLEKGNRQWGGDMMRDKEAIAKWLSEEKNVKKDKIGIFGWSYGGYAALAGAAFSPDTYACAISMYGPTYLDAPKEENAFGYAPNSLLRIADVTTEEGLELAHKHSPLYAAQDVSIPILLSTGSKDERVPQMQMDKMAEALKKEGKDVSYLVYPDEEHDYRNKNSWTTFWAVGEQFLSLHLGGFAETIQKEEDFSQVEVKFLSKEIKIKNR